MQPLRGTVTDYSWPDALTSTGQTLELTLTAASGNQNIDDFPNPQNMYGYNNNLPTPIPPTLYLDPNDTLDLTLNDEMEVSQFQNHTPPIPTGTNLHFHGFNVSPNNLGDNSAPTDSVYIDIQPPAVSKALNSYEYKIPLPSSHPKGSFWYHPHPHGATEPQLLGGMAGLIVIRGLLETYYPEVSNLIGDKVYDTIGKDPDPSTVVERVFLLKDYVPSSGMGGCATKAVNGLLAGNVNVTSHLPQLWRFANAGADQFYRLQIVDETNTAVKMYVVAVDGNPATAASCTPNACPNVVTDLPIAPGSRMDVLIQFVANKTYNLNDLGTTAGDPNCPMQLGTITVTGDDQPILLPSLLKSTVPIPVPGSLAPCTIVDATGKTVDVTVQFETISTTGSQQFSVLPNEQPYQPQTVNYIVQNAPCTSTWTITNNTTPTSRGPEAHVFHIHQTDFLVQPPTQTDPASGVYVAAPGYQDTLTVPTGATATVLIPFEIPGYFVYHCHILNHEDLGMMANICVQTGKSGDPACGSTPPFFPASSAAAHHH
jgi:FtsP/CotA-like multicopper oxidase with cupredoxin domain